MSQKSHEHLIPKELVEKFNIPKDLFEKFNFAINLDFNADHIIDIFKFEKLSDEQVQDNENLPKLQSYKLYYRFKNDEDHQIFHETVSKYSNEEHWQTEAVNIKKDLTELSKIYNPQNQDYELSSIIIEDLKDLTELSEIYNPQNQNYELSSIIIEDLLDWAFFNLKTVYINTSDPQGRLNISAEEASKLFKFVEKQALAKNYEVKWVNAPVEGDTFSDDFIDEILYVDRELWDK